MTSYIIIMRNTKVVETANARLEVLDCSAAICTDGTVMAQIWPGYKMTSTAALMVVLFYHTGD